MREELERALQQDGDDYHARNYSGIGTIADPAFEAMELIHRLAPIGSVLEIGCTTGFRLEKARAAFNARCAGLEVSPAAIAEGRSRYPQVQLELGLAPRDLERWDGQAFDVVIVGHFQYLLPRSEVFSLAAAVDRLLASGGHLITMDFLHPTPMQAPYSHHADLRVYKHDPSAPWSWSPTYALVSRRVYDISEHADECVDPRAWQTVDVLRKLTDEQAYPPAATRPSVHDEQRA